MTSQILTLCFLWSGYVGHHLIIKYFRLLVRCQFILHFCNSTLISTCAFSRRPSFDFCHSSILNKLFYWQLIYFFWCYLNWLVSECLDYCINETHYILYIFSIFSLKSSDAGIVGVACVLCTRRGHNRAVCKSQSDSRLHALVAAIVWTWLFLLRNNICSTGIDFPGLCFTLMRAYFQTYTSKTLTVCSHICSLIQLMNI